MHFVVPSFSTHPDELVDSTKSKLNDRSYVTFYIIAAFLILTSCYTFSYFYANSNAGMGWTDRANREAFYRWRIVPRMLVDTNVRDLTSELNIWIKGYLIKLLQRLSSAIRSQRLSFSRQLVSTSCTRLKENSYQRESQVNWVFR